MPHFENNQKAGTSFKVNEYTLSRLIKEMVDVEH